MTTTAVPPSTAFIAAYHRWRGRSLGRITDALEQRLLLTLLGEVQGRNVLDVGCGDGALALELARCGALVTGVDVSPAAIAAAGAAARAGRLAASFAVADARALPLPAAAFDRVLMVTVLCFVADPVPLLAEAARVLRPGGRLVVGELGRFNLWAVQRRRRGARGDPLWRRAHFRSGGELARLAARAGLRVVEQRAAIVYPPWGGAARLLAPLDPILARCLPAVGAFQALAAERRPG